MKKRTKRCCMVLTILGFLLLIPTVVVGLEPGEILVVVNSNVPNSKEIGEYYQRKRKIPKSNFLHLSTSAQETISRQSYESEIKNVVQKKILNLQNNDKISQKSRIAAIVTIYGVPLKIYPNKTTQKTTKQIEELRSRLKEITFSKTTSKDEVAKNRANLQGQIETLLRVNTRASVDSELMLVKMENYKLDGWIANPYFPGNVGQKLPVDKNSVLLVSRLDGPDVESVYRIIDDSMAVEKVGLKGKGYFDARGLVGESDDQNNLGTGYKRYDHSIKLAAKSTEERLEVTLDEKPELFGVNSCPSSALYCGWYSLGKYIDSFSWSKGAVGYHIASAECVSLRSTARPLWCRKMIEQGVAATIGPVYEPYVQGFPLPEIFFKLLTEGYMTLGEAYLVSLPVISWQMVLIGDPLYQPFKPNNIN